MTKRDVEAFFNRECEPGALVEITSTADFVKVRQTMAGAKAAARVEELRGSKPTRLIDELAELGLDTRAEAPPLTYHLTYEDADGQVTNRVVILRRIEPSRAGLRLVCWCHSAEAIRSFWAERIREVFCVVTGEVFDDAVGFFSNHPMLTEPRDPEGYALKVCKHEVNLLVIVAAADGRFDPREQDRILIHVFDRLPELSLDEDVLRLRLALLAPDCAAFDSALLQLGRFKVGDPVMLMRTMRKLVDADDQIAREEALFVSEIEQKLRSRLESYAGA